MTPPRQLTLDHIKALLRRDLKLPPGTTIPDDMPLIGGPLDLDSLDVLMVITSIEKEYGLTSLAETGGRDVFVSVATLAAFLDEHTGNSKPQRESGPHAGDPDLDAALRALPHAAPFRFVSEVTALTPGTTAQGVWRLDGSEAFFAGHFPGQPIVPGVLIAEALAQLAGIVLASPRQPVNSHSSAAPSPIGKLGRVEVRFLRPVTPPADIALQATLTRQIGDAAVFDVQAAVANTPVAEGSIWLAVTPSSRPGPA